MLVAAKFEISARRKLWRTEDVFGRHTSWGLAEHHRTSASPGAVDKRTAVGPSPVQQALQIVARQFHTEEYFAEGPPVDKRLERALTVQSSVRHQPILHRETLLTGEQGFQQAAY
jgi:hypothetical protein